MEGKLLDNQPSIKKLIIQEQLEYYFSNVNLKDDWYLFELIQKDENGYVSLEVLKNFDRIRKVITEKDTAVVKLAASQSNLLKISYDGTKVKRIKSYDKSPTSENFLRQMLRLIRRKIELQFTDYHLTKNIPLFMLIEENSQGYVELEFFESLNVRNIRIDDTKLIAAALSNSSTLKVSEDGTSVRRVTDPFSPDLWDFHTVVVENLPNEINGRKVRHMFEQCGEIECLRFFTSGQGIKDCFVQFCRPDSVFKACEEFQFVKKENVSKKGGNTTQNLQTTSKSNSFEDEEVSDDVIVQYMSKSFENLLTADIEDFEQKKGKRKRSFLNDEIPDTKRIHLDTDSISQQAQEIYEFSSSAEKYGEEKNLIKNHQIKVIPMDLWKRRQLKKLRTHLRSLEQLEGFGEVNEDEQSPDVKIESNNSK